MYLYLIRHGIAVDRDLSQDSPISDESRSLTKVGRKKTTQVADRLHESGLKFDLVMTSPLVRAQQTAQIAIDRHLSDRLEVASELAPDGNLHSWLSQWESRTSTEPITKLALVGHAPNLEEWAELLIFGKVLQRIVLKKGGVIGLKFADERIAIGTAQLYCLLPPKYLVDNE